MSIQPGLKQPCLRCDRKRHLEQWELFVGHGMWQQSILLRAHPQACLKKKKGGIFSLEEAMILKTITCEGRLDFWTGLMSSGTSLAFFLVMEQSVQLLLDGSTVKYFSSETNKIGVFFFNISISFLERFILRAFRRSVRKTFWFCPMTCHQCSF